MGTPSLEDTGAKEEEATPCTTLYSTVAANEEGIAACQHFLEINHMPTVPTLQLIRFILTHNYFSLGDAIYLQLMGSAMGSKMAPQYANLFMAQLEENDLASCNTRPLTYLRKIARDLQPMLHTNTQLKQIFPELPLLSYRQPPNLRKMIVRSALPKTTKADQVAIPNTQKVYTILDHYSCASSNVVYMITWNFKTERERKIYEFKCMELFNTLRQGLNLGSGFMSHCVT
ncbi:hypothetical protein XELAEV_18040110mg [Xenopus laevis]|uniref:Uncharacterized protein n=1 Tax=Xenopus laevis TaxID=8355 RepID=A0A974C9G3_XENLA|nr:hypothetical protein XELAEV_18040110mg [Xenopus laevis]